VMQRVALTVTGAAVNPGPTEIVCTIVVDP
jgi:hypothetical protein